VITHGSSSSREMCPPVTLCAASRPPDGGFGSSPHREDHHDGAHAAAIRDGAAKRTFSAQQKSLHEALSESSEHRFKADRAPSAARGAVARTFHERNQRR